ncbi:hypothetical protein SAMN04487829_1743 [Pseudobutyrivibrio sp. NOR37]|uniref:Peptidase C39 domain-containing protein n=1 Tax=Pseudobutyrivibrio xylanivorans TaxID=185007 RepID=A0A6M0LI15_PSEXY|nr:MULTISPECIES: hypothetical protein [Pseudobutyrivibrio]NEX02122.1 hypothetical protein [Pseudobutyrivibrio xylanivorans]SFR76148.1 hypothetical protein SAMN04487829_1743 [Pseudobutyrivibrio sp. NOR37]
MKLQFHKKGIPTNILKRMAVLFVVFIISVVFFEIITNISESVKVSKQSDATLPIVSINFLGDASTELHGYVNEMDPAYMRDAIIPLDSERNVNISIQCKDFDVDSLEYAILSLDTQRNISKNKLNFNKKGDIITASFQAENLIEKNEEYLLVLTIKNDEREVYYYTRIMQPEGCNEEDILDFAQYFHKTALSDDAGDLATYIEPDPYTTSEDLSHVTINSSLSQVAYGTFDGKQVGDVRVSLTDISTNYITLTFNYLLTRKNDDKSEYYTCSEDFRIRYTADRIYLLAYDRTMEQLLDEDSVVIKNNLLNIGITDPNVQYLSNETGTIVSFVQNGSLYEYNQTDRKMKEIFTFVDNPTDSRLTYDQHQVLLLNIDESGTMDYVVYGYMNSGNHEGQCGINLFHYDAINDVSTEQVFITTSSSYQILNANFSELLYETADNDFYIMVNGTLLYMSLNELTTKELMTGLDDAQYAVSGSRRYLAWMDEATVAEVIHIMDLETGSSFDIKANEGEVLKPLAFIEDDFIYGAVKKNDIMVDGAGSTIYPMYKLTISGISTGKAYEQKTYQKSGYYINNIDLQSYTIYLDRIKIDADGTILPVEEDTIKNSVGEQNKAVPINTAMDDVKQQVVIFSMTPLEEDEKLGKVDYEMTGLVLADESRTVSVASATSSTQYFVYVGSKVSLATDDLISAIAEADANMGIVLDNEPKYVWKRGRKSYQNTITGIAVGSSDSEASGMARALSAMLVHEGENVQVHNLIESGETPISILSRTLKGYDILDLTGASLTQVLYYVNLGNPVYAYTGDDTAVLIVGYDAANIIYFDPMTNTNSKMGLSDAQEYFETYGNVFVSYIN